MKLFKCPSCLLQQSNGWALQLAWEGKNQTAFTALRESQQELKVVSTELQSVLKLYLDAFLAGKKRCDNNKLQIYFYVSSCTSTRDKDTENELDAFFCYDQVPFISGQTTERTRPRF